MYRTHRVQVLGARCSLEHGTARADLHDGEVECLGDGRVGQFTLQHGLHLLQPGLAVDLVRPCHPGARAGQQRLQHFVFFGDPLGQCGAGIGWGGGHGVHCGSF